MKLQGWNERAFSEESRRDREGGGRVGRKGGKREGRREEGERWRRTRTNGIK